jgi:hypothetical protein
MLGNATKYFAGLAVLALGMFVGYGFAEAMGQAIWHVDGADYRPVGVGILGGLAVAFALLSVVTSTAGDVPGDDRLRLHRHPAHPSWWPILAVLGVSILTVGLVVDTSLTVTGLLVVGFAAVEWVIVAWSERLSTDPASNEEQRLRLARPLEIPLLAAAVIAIPVLLVSRVLLAVDTNTASWLALAIMIVVVAGAFVFYAVPGVRKEIVIAIVAIAGLTIIVSGVIAAAVGEREFHDQFEEEEGGGAETEEPAGETSGDSLGVGGDVDLSAPVVLG